MGKFVKLDEDLLASDAWAFLKPASKVLYIELKRQFTGSNNGSIFLSHRDAAHAISVHRNTVGRHYKALESVGLIVATEASKSGPSGVGQSTHWRLTELPVQSPKPPKKKRTFDKKKPPKFTPKQSFDGDDSILDDEVGF